MSYGSVLCEGRQRGSDLEAPKGEWFGKRIEFFMSFLLSMPGFYKVFVRSFFYATP